MGIGKWKMGNRMGLLRSQGERVREGVGERESEGAGEGVRRGSIKQKKPGDAGQYREDE